MQERCKGCPPTSWGAEEQSNQALTDTQRPRMASCSLRLPGLSQGTPALPAPMQTPHKGPRARENRGKTELIPSFPPSLAS